MKNYVKIILYAYPLLKTVEQDYEEHIKNKAVLSYGSKLTAESLAEYLAGEILQMRKLEWLKGKVAEVLSSLTEIEGQLIRERYFRGGRSMKKAPSRSGQSFAERTYFRMQTRLGRKIASVFVRAGLTEAAFDAEFAGIPLFQRVARFVARKEAVYGSVS